MIDSRFESNISDLHHVHVQQAGPDTVMVTENWLDTVALPEHEVIGGVICTEISVSEFYELRDRFENGSAGISLLGDALINYIH